MTDEDRFDASPDAPERDSKDDDAMRALLKRALEHPADPPGDAPPPDLLRGVQRKLRQRSRGKFYADGWSTAQTRVSYALVATVMLVVLAIAYFALGPMGITR